MWRTRVAKRQAALKLPQKGRRPRVSVIAQGRLGRKEGIRPLLHSYRLGEVAGLVDVAAAQ